MLEAFSAMFAFIPYQYLKLFPLEFAILIGAIVFLITFQLRNRSIYIDDVAKVNKIQIDQINALMHQTKLMTEELAKVRKELTEAHSVIDEMRKEVNSLEDMIRKHRAQGQDRRHFEDDGK